MRLTTLFSLLFCFFEKICHEIFKRTGIRIHDPLRKSAPPRYPVWVVLGTSAGELHGRFVRYFASGQPQEQGLFVDGKREGEYTEYYGDGKPYLTATYRAGNMDGPMTVHDESGAIAAQGTVVDERIQGDWLCYGSLPGVGNGNDPGEPIRVRDDCEGRAYWECTCP